MHARHVRMEKHGSVREPNDRECVPDEPLSIERAQHLPPGFSRHYEQRGGLHFKIIFAPDFLLQCDASLKLFHAVAFADDDSFAHRTLRTSGQARKAPFSDRFAISQNLSISSRGTSARGLPASAASCSMRRNRDENFALAFFSAISGSMCR